MKPLYHYRRLFAVVLLLATLVTVSHLLDLRSHFSLEFLRQTILAHEVGGLLLFILLFSLGNLAQIPGWIFLAAAVLTLGQLGGGVVTYVAASISCGVTFLLIRLLGADALRQLDGKWASAIFARLDSSPVSSVAALRLLFQTAPALNYALAMSGVRFRQYMVGTLLGLPLPIALYCLFFDYLAKALKLL